MGIPEDADDSVFVHVFGWIAMVLSPCVLPVLPAILSGGMGKGRYRPLGIILGLMVSFAFFTLSLTYLVHLFGFSANLLRYAAIVIIALFGLVMLFPALGNRFAQATGSVGDWGAALQSHEAAQKSGFGGGLVLGAALGLVWTPCAGPILAVVTTLVATQSVTVQVVLLTIAYSLGTGIPLFLIAYGGNRALNAMPFFKRRSEEIKRLFGLLMILTAVALYFNLESYLQQWAIEHVPMIEIEKDTRVQAELNKLRPASPFSEENVARIKQLQGVDLPQIGAAPEIVGITEWINSPPLKIAQLKGKVVLVDFWTYSCINCLRTLPFLKEWNQKYKDQGLVIIGVHTPEFEFEKNGHNVKQATERYGVLYPVALDNDYKTWQAYNNLYWPAHYLIDQEGLVRQVHFGEGGYLETENAIRSLLGMSPIEGKEVPKKASRPLTAETYLGRERGHYYQPGIALKTNETAEYTYTPPLQSDHVGLKGAWRVEAQKITSESDASELSLNFIASQVYLVMEAKGPQTVAVLLDGEPLPKSFYTADMDSEGRLLVQEARKYDVINLKGEYGRHLLTLRMPKGVSAFAFTFGDESEYFKK